MSYVGKWVVVNRYPNRQNNYIGKIQCLFIMKETKEMVYGCESEENSHWRYQYNKSEIVRVIDKSEKHEILQAQRHTKKNYRKNLEDMHKIYSIAIGAIANGKRKVPFKFLGG